jgi:hypothetical protein
MRIPGDSPTQTPQTSPQRNLGPVGLPRHYLALRPFPRSTRVTRAPCEPPRGTARIRPGEQSRPMIVPYPRMDADAVVSVLAPIPNGSKSLPASLPGAAG